MNTKEEQHHTDDFENAPVWTTATHKATGNRAVKIDDSSQCWRTLMGDYVGNENMEGFTLDPTAPTTASEALDLAWELAHEVRPGQVIPADVRFLQFFSSGLGEFTAELDIMITPELAPVIRTFTPLQTPDWLDAPAVLATADCCCPDQEVWFPRTSGCWKCAAHGRECHWSELENVVPLYPRQDA